MEEGVRSTKTVAKAVLCLQHILLDHGAPSEHHLVAASALLSRPDYSDVVIERTISSLCGFPLCPNPLPPSSHKSRARYHISLSEHRVYDLEEINKFCCEKCLVASKAYEASLGEKRSFDLTREKIEGVLRLFEEGDVGNEELGLGFENGGDLGKEIRIVEKKGGVIGEMTFDEWVGSAQSIEGYVPKFDLHKGSKNRIEQSQEMDFRSEIFFGDGAHGFSPSETKDISEGISKKLESIALQDKKKINKKKNNETSKPSSKERNTQNFTTTILVEGHSSSSSRSSNTNLKSSLKKNECNSKSRNNVKWADNENEGRKNSLKSKSISYGKSSADETVSEAEIVILPPPQYENEKISDENDKEDSFESDRGIVKWPKKPALLETDVFDVDDSWHDTPPQGFDLTLSTFATIWMSIFEWVTCSSISFIYGHGEDHAKEYMEANGREYPCKIVLQNGQSAEIRKTLDYFLCYSLPSLVSDLKLPVPVSTLEKNLALLIDTMSFVEALPSLGTKQWRVVVLLFLDALSVYHLPYLASILANRNMILHKVLDAAQITGEEYDSMINLFLPLGRSSLSMPFNK